MSVCFRRRALPFEGVSAIAASSCEGSFSSSAGALAFPLEALLFPVDVEILDAPLIRAPLRGVALLALEVSFTLVEDSASSPDPGTS